MDELSEIDSDYANNVAKKIQKRTVETIHFHSDYKYPRAYSDIALVKLNESVRLTDNVYPICIPHKEEAKSNALAGTTSTMVGYGPDTKGSTTLNDFWATIKSKKFCAFKYNLDRTNSPQLMRKINATLPKKFKDNSLICATSRAERGTCKGKDFF